MYAPRVVRNSSGAEEQPSLGDLIGRMNSDLGTLLRKEIQLAKVEMAAEAKKAGKGAGMLGGAGFAGYMALVMLSFAAAWGLSVLIPVGWAFLAVGFLYLLVTGALFLRGRMELKRVHGPQQTTETLKEDVEWARAQMK